MSVSATGALFQPARSSGSATAKWSKSVKAQRKLWVTNRPGEWRRSTAACAWLNAAISAEAKRRQSSRCAGSAPAAAASGTSIADQSPLPTLASFFVPQGLSRAALNAATVP